MNHLLEITDMTVCYGKLTVVDRVSLTLDPGQWLMLTGPNGAGKSTIISALSQGVPFEGEALCMGKSIRKWKRTELARILGVLDQQHSIGYAFRVEEVVRMGRYAYRKGMLGSDEGCEAAVDHALELTGLSALKSRSVLELSGGELQRVFLAQLFAQDPTVLILDEPANHLDLIYQKQVFSLIREWVREKDRAVLSVVHDLSLAKAFGSHALLLQKGRAISCGQTEDVLTGEHLREAYGMDVGEWMRYMLSQWE